VGEGERRDEAWRERRREVEDLDAVGVGDESVLELDGDLTRIAQDTGHGRSGELGVEGVGDVHHGEAGGADDVEIGAGHVSVGGAVEGVAGIKADDIFFLVEEVIGRIAIEKGGGEDHDETLVAVGYVEEAVVEADGLLLVLGQADAQRIEGEGGGGDHARGVAGFHIQTLAERGDGGGGDALGEGLVVHIGDVEDDETGLAGGGVEILAALEQVENLAATMVVVGLGEDRFQRDVFGVVARVGEALEVGANGGLRFLALGPDDGIEAGGTGGDVGVAAKEVDRAGAEAEELSHPSVVVVGGGKVAIGAALGGADGRRGVWEVGVESLAAPTDILPKGKCKLRSKF